MATYKMKLAEALVLRADCKKRLQQLRERLARSARVQEGQDPPENPQELIEEMRQVLDQFTSLVKKINRTNSHTAFENEINLTDALAERDALSEERHILAEVIDAATGQQIDRRGRYMIPEVRYFRAINVSKIQKRIDELAKRYRELDSRIQAMNWNIDLIE
jgi:hypothetical protein